MLILCILEQGDSWFGIGYLFFIRHWTFDVRCSMLDVHLFIKGIMPGSKATNHQKRLYRNRVQPTHLVSFTVTVKETDLSICADKALGADARELVFQQRSIIESFIERYPAFLKSLQPWKPPGPAPRIIGDMADAGEKAGVGPMAAVAGAIAEHVGSGLLHRCREVIVENGGDIFLKTEDPVVVGLFAGNSPLSFKFGIRIKPENNPVSLCTSSGTVGHSKSFGKSDAVSVKAKSCPLADAAATAIGNRVGSKKDIKQAMDFGRSITGVTGLVIIIGDEMGAWGDLELVPLGPKKG